MKPIILIVDDMQGEITSLVELLDLTSFKDNYEIITCRSIYSSEWIQSQNPDIKKTLVDLIEELQQQNKTIDFAFIDREYQKEFEEMPDSYDYGFEEATKLIKEKHPYCIITANSKHVGGGIKDTYSSFQVIKKDTNTEHTEYNKKIKIDKIHNQIEEWIKLKCLQLNNNARNKVIEAITGDSVNWDCTISFNGENWTFEELFFTYKDLDLSKVRKKLFGYLIKLPENIDKDSTTQKFNSKIFDYYYELYLNYITDFEEIEKQAKDILNIIKDYIYNYYESSQESKDYIKENFKDFKDRILNILNKNRIEIIAYKVASVENGYEAISEFKHKLIIRLVYLGSYIFFKSSPKVLYLIFNKFQPFEEQNSRQTAQYIFLKGFEYKCNEETNILFDFYNYDEYEKHESKRKYFKLLNKYSGSDEIVFLQKYYNGQLKEEYETKNRIKEIFKENIKILQNIKIKDIAGVEKTFIS